MKKRNNEANIKKAPWIQKGIDGAEGLYARFKAGNILIHPTFLVLVTYILLLITKVIDVTLINRENEYFSVVILQMMVFLLPGAIWCMFSGEKYVSRLRLRPVMPDSIIIIISAAVLLSAGGLLLTVLFGGLDSISNSFSLYDTFVSKDQGTIPNKIYLVIAYAVLPAVCEEFVYRGILCNEYERGGVLRAVIVSSVFFALLHFNLQNLPLYLFSGVILSMTLYATRSLFGSVLTHFLYNLFCLFGQPYMSNLYRITNSPKLFLIIVGVAFILSAAVFCGEAARLYKKYLYRGYPADYRQPVIKDGATLRRSYVDVIRQPSAIACFVIYIVALIISWF